jgi:hypothetical protein
MTALIDQIYREVIKGLHAGEGGAIILNRETCAKILTDQRFCFNYLPRQTNLDGTELWGQLVVVIPYRTRDFQVVPRAWAEWLMEIRDRPPYERRSQVLTKGLYRAIREGDLLDGLSSRQLSGLELTCI